MIDFLINIGWVIVWAVTLFCSITTATFVIHDVEFDQWPWGPWVFLLTPVLWAVIIIFFFN